jgi:hypothetical protein
MKREEELLSEKAINQIRKMGIPLERVYEQLDTFRKGLPYLELIRPALVGDGIKAIKESEKNELLSLHQKWASEGKIIKFVPASGAASRMFKSLLAVFNSNETPSRSSKDDDVIAFFHFIENIEKFAFYDDLREIVSQKGENLDQLLAEEKYHTLLDLFLNEAGLNYCNLPKALLKFHKYKTHSRTPIEEHIVEGIQYAGDKNGLVHIHFTVSEEHRELFCDYFESIKHLYENQETKIQISTSVQKVSTNTIAVTPENKPFTDDNGQVYFRPAGHGALLENLSDLQGHVVAVKNIDNVSPDYLKEDTFEYKKLLCGLLIKLQQKSFAYLEKIDSGLIADKDIEELKDFLQKELFIHFENSFWNKSHQDQLREIKQLLNRPIRVCGMVKNTGEPGGGPFWVKGKDGKESLQIIESSQINLEDKQQKELFHSSKYFNPVDLVCGIRDYKGNLFNLAQYVDPETAFICTKYKDGKELKALEVPGLWNGAMAFWNTVFVEVPLSTFTPVKTINDLLKPEHQPALIS